ncbi:hypothetical protein Sste5346_010229 [Sporothrix stenoceras]|uniref:RTA1 domain protein n=1 Tax=Sporothrix stenoceras TaxID=5173 RepID=A0ABR3YJ33_9PEZI
MAGDDVKKAFVFYNYKPNLAAAILFSVLFFIMTFAHVTRMAMKRTWYFVPFVLGCLSRGGAIVEAVGYIGRALSSKEAPDFTKDPYIVQSLLILLGPTLMAATVYMVLGRLVLVLQGEKNAIIKPRWITKVFVTGDVLSFFTQGAGPGLLSAAKIQSDVNKANYIIVGGLAIQILFFGFFIVVTAFFHRRITMILIRSVYRMAEYAQGSAGELQKKEFWLYIFDSLPIIVVTLSSSTVEGDIDMANETSSGM